MTTTSHMIPYFFGLKGPTGFSSRSTAEETSAGVDLTGRVAIVTGEINLRSSNCAHN